MATKQVQMTEDDTPKYKTTYHGQHTCKSMMMKSSQIMLDTARDSSILLSFESNNQDISSPFFSSFPYIKQEEEIPSDQEVTHKNNPTNNNHNNSNNSSSSDYLLSQELTTFESNLGSTDHGDVLSGVNSSCTDSTHGLDDIMMDFDDVLISF